MNTAYNNNTTVQESRNRYNQLLQAALKRINDRKSNKDAEEVTTTEATATTPTQQPEPVATPENVTTEPNEASEPEQVTAIAPTKTRRTKTTSPKPLGRDIYHIFYEKQSRWAIMFDKSVYHDPEGYAVLSDNVILIESKLDYKEEHSGKLIQEDGTESKKDPQLLSKYKEICRPTGDKYATTPKEIEERIKAVQDEEKHTALCDLFDKDMTPEEVKEELKYNKEARAHANAKANPKFVKLLFPTGDYTFLHLKQLKRGLSVAKKLGTNCISKPNNILQFAGEAGRIIVAGCIISPEDESAIAHLTIDLTDATLAPEDTAIEEATPATAPQPTEEDTATAPEATAETPVQEPEEVTTEESPEMTVEQEDDKAPVLLDLIKRYGNLGAKYLESLDYTQAEEREYRSVKRGVSKLEQKYYTTEDGAMYGLFRRYSRNGKRVEFVAYKDGKGIETRTYRENNINYGVEIQYDGVKFGYYVKDGKITGGTYAIPGKLIIVRFDDTNRPETPRDLPAPAPTKTAKETTKEAPATTEQEQPTSKPAPTPETTTTPEEVKEVTTSNQENGTVPYWLLLDNELRAQQEEQATAPATPEATKQEEPMHAPQMLKKIIEEQKRLAAEGTNKIPLKTAVGMTTEVLTPKRAKELLGDNFDDFKTYVLVDGSEVVRFERPELSKTLYIDDESPEYKEYQRGNISAVELYRNEAMGLNTPAHILDTIKRGHPSLKVIDVKGDVLVFTEDGGYSGCRRATPDEVEICKAAAREASEAFTKRLDSYLKRYGKKIYVHSYWANR